MKNDKQNTYQRKWYRSQKNNGLIYIITIKNTGDTYIGGTTNSLKKRLYQHRSRSTASTRYFVDLYGKDCMEIKLIEKCTNVKEAKEREQYWIDKLKPTINKACVVRKKINKRKECYKGGIEFEGDWYPTKKILWETKGKVPFGTFKSRLHRGFSLERALGTSNSLMGT